MNPPVSPDKVLPPIPTAELDLGDNLLGLGLGYIETKTSSATAGAAGIVVISAEPNAKHAKQSTTPAPPIASSSSSSNGPRKLLIRTHSPSTPPGSFGAGSSARHSPVPSPLTPIHPGRPAQSRSGSSSTIHLNRSTNTLTPSMSPITPVGSRKPSAAAASTPSRMAEPSTTPVGRGGRPKLMTSASAGQIGRKRSSGQLLMGIGKGLNRVGSVMRRNTSDSSAGVSTPSPAASLTSSLRGRPWRRRAKGRPTDELDENGVWASKVRDEHDGDPGVGRPFNVEHDLHVSPSLEDLPPLWLEDLKSRGLTEQDLLLISSARRRQQSVANTPISQRVRTPKTARSVPTPLEVHGSFARMPLRSDESPFLPAIVASPIDLAGIEHGSEHRSRANEVSDETIVDTHSPGSTSAASSPPPLDTRRRSPKRNKRMSDQLRTFSQFDLGNDESWGKSLLDIMNVGDRPERPEPLTLAPQALGDIEEVATPVPPPKDSPASAMASVPSREASPLSDTGPITPDKRSIRRIPIPPLLASSPSPPLDLTDLDVGRHLINSSQPPIAEVEGRTRSRAPSSASSDGIRPLRKSSDSFCVHYSQSKSSVELELVTPSASQSDARATSPMSSEEMIPATEEGSELDFANLLADGRYTPASSASEKLKAIVEPIMPARHAGPPLQALSRPNPHFSLPASAASSFPSRANSPDVFRPEHDPDPMSRLDSANRDERASIALSIISNESMLHNSLHEATVQLAYTKVLGRLKEVEEDADGVGPKSRARRREVDSVIDGGSEAGFSALDALDEAARVIAGQDAR